MTKAISSQQDSAPEDRVIRQDTKKACAACGVRVKPEDFVREAGKEVQCLECAGLGELLFLPSGDPALTRRATKLSRRVVIAMEWNRRRKRWERRGTYVDPDAFAEAEAECVIDSDRRAEARERARVRAEAADREYIARFAEAIRLEFPGLPEGTEVTIAEHACEKHSGRVGRTAAAKQFDRDMVTRAVIAHARHLHTGYDDLRDMGVNKRDSRGMIAPEIRRILSEWRGGESVVTGGG